VSVVGVLLSVGLSVGLAVQSCDVGGTSFTIDDLRDPITVTNTSTDQDALVFVSTSLGERDFHLAPGGSRTVLTLAARKYTVEVYAPDDPSGATYKQSLLDLRSQLQDLTLTPEAPASVFAGSIAELAVVESALQQLHSSKSFQSCSAPIKTGVANHATLTWTTSAVTGTGIWGLSCG
jgi:hypothetical protein